MHPTPWSQLMTHESLQPARQPASADAWLIIQQAGGVVLRRRQPRKAESSRQPGYRRPDEPSSVRQTLRQPGRRHVTTDLMS